MLATRFRVASWPAPGCWPAPRLRLLVVAALAVSLVSIGASQTPVDWPPAAETPDARVPAAELFSGLNLPAGGKNSPPPQTAFAGEMIGFSHVDGSGTQTITLVHTGKSWMAVYHVDRSGVIQLVSSRPIDADFSLQFNATSPLPEEIRKLGGTAR